MLDMLNGERNLCLLYIQAITATSRENIRQPLQQILQNEYDVTQQLASMMQRVNTSEATTTAIGENRRRVESRRTDQTYFNSTNKITHHPDSVEAALVKSAQREKRVFDSPPWDLM